MARKDLISGLTNGDLKCFVCTADKNEVKKTKWISTKSPLVIHNVHLKDDIDSLDPTFIFNSDERLLLEYNYCYYYNTRRFYWFKKPPKLMTGGRMELECEGDPAYTFMLEIGDCMAFEDRSSAIGTGYVEDPEIVFNASPLLKTYEFHNFPNQNGFTGESYMLKVANNLGLAAVPDPEPAPGTPTTYYDTLGDYTLVDVTLQKAIVNKIEEWRANNVMYSQDFRTGNNYRDCSSLIVRAFNEALNLDNWCGGTSNPYDTRSIARWFWEHSDYHKGIFSIRENSIRNKSLALTAGDLVFFEGGSSKSGFPMGESEFLKRIFGKDKKEGNVPYYGINHIAFCYRGFQKTKMGPVELNMPKVKGYDINIDNVITTLYPDSDTHGYPSSGKVYPYATNGDTYYPPIGGGGMWVLEALPPKNCPFSTMDANGNYKMITGTKKKNSNGDSVIALRQGGILLQERSGTNKIISETYDVEDKIMDFLASAGTYDEFFSWQDTSMYFAIRPNYTKIVQDFVQGGGE